MIEDFGSMLAGFHRVRVPVDTDGEFEGGFILRIDDFDHVRFMVLSCFLVTGKKELELFYEPVDDESTGE